MLICEWHANDANIALTDIIDRMQSLKLISLNIEGDRHLPQVTEFLKREKGDVVCLQEVLKDNIPDLVVQTGYGVNFVPMVRIIKPTIWAKNTRGEVGVAILTKEKISKYEARYYFGGKGKVPIFNINDFSNIWRVLLWVEIEKENKKYVIANTHFTWTSKGESTPEQFRDLVNLSKVLSKIDNCVLCGDFNAPRGARLHLARARSFGGQGEIWGKLAEKYKDNIPLAIKTTIDPDLHRDGALQLVVDGLFSTEKYKISDVKVVGGISDHKAMVGNIAVE